MGLRNSALVCLLLCGCAAKKPVAVVHIPRQCITAVQLSDHTECNGDKEKLNCSGLNLTFVKGCAVLEVKSKEKQ